jgi:phage terminase large subunit-like protein
MTDFFEQLAYQLADAAKKPNVLVYKPNSGVHEDFHKSTKVGRILRGGNRSGKSVAGTVEGIWRSTGKHPYQRTHDVPTRGRIVTVDRDAGLKQIILPLLKQWTPPSELVNGAWEDSWSNSDKVMRFRNGSEIEIKTHQQEVESFAGVPRHWIHFDEECPQSIFNECRLRLVDFNGVWWMTMTPVEGQDWIYDRYIATEAKNVDRFEVDISDNPHLNKRALELLDDDLDDEEKKIRRQGLFVPKGGLVLREFDYNRHVVPGGRPVPPNWKIYESVDHGFNAPTAVLWHAVSPQGDVVTFKEHYQRAWVIRKHAERIKQVRAELGRDPVLSVCDPSMSQRRGENENGLSAIQVYQQHGIRLMPAKRDVDGRIVLMNEYLKYDKWHITEDCPNTIKEARGYSFKIYHSAKIADRNNVREEPNKKNDHAMDSAGYFFNFMPRIQPQPQGSFGSLTERNTEDFPWEVDRSFYHSPTKYSGAFGEYD